MLFVTAGSQSPAHIGWVIKIYLSKRDVSEFVNVAMEISKYFEEILWNYFLFSLKPLSTNFSICCWIPPTVIAIVMM